MANYLVTPNMNLPNPVPGVDPGPDYANNLSSSLNQIDQHNHSAGQGVQIQPNGLNISSDLPFNGNNAIALNSVRFNSLVSPLANSAPNIGCLYVSGNELFYNDYTGGNQVQITSNGGVNATSSGISSGTASASFSAGTLVVKASSTSFANIDMQSAVLSNSGNTANLLTLQAPTLSSSYVLTLPTIPAQTNVMTLDASGNMGSITYDAVGQDMSSVGANAIGVTMTATGANAVAATRTRSSGSSVGVGGVAISGSSGNFTTASTSATPVTNLSVTIITSGRPVYVGLIADGSGVTASVGGFYTGGASTGFTYLGGEFYILRNGAIISASETAANIPNDSGASQIGAPPGAVWTCDAVAQGTYTYTVEVKSIGGGNDASVGFCKLVAYEL